MRIFVDWLHALLSAAFALILWFAFITSVYDVFPALALAVVGFAIAGLVHPHVKKHVFQKTVIFDVHGVILGGDFNLERLYEIQGTRDLIQRLREKYKVAALTNMGPEMYEWWMVGRGLTRVYDYVYYSGQFRIKKPDAKLFQIVLKDLCAKPCDTVFLDDVAENVDAAKKLGIRGIVFKDAMQAEEELKKMGFGS